MSPDETYVPVKAALVRVTPDAAILAVGASGRRVTIPRSLIHGADERTLDGLATGHAQAAREITLRIFLWKAREQGLLNTTINGGADRDLFEGKRT